jgi:hypothetical protein
LAQLRDEGGGREEFEREIAQMSETTLRDALKALLSQFVSARDHWLNFKKETQISSEADARAREVALRRAWEEAIEGVRVERLEMDSKFTKVIVFRLFVNFKMQRDYEDKIAFLLKRAAGDEDAAAMGRLVAARDAELSILSIEFQRLRASHTRDQDELQRLKEQLGLLTPSPTPRRQSLEESFDRAVERALNNSSFSATPRSSSPIAPSSAQNSIPNKSSMSTPAPAPVSNSPAPLNSPFLFKVGAAELARMSVEDRAVIMREFTRRIKRVCAEMRINLADVIPPPLINSPPAHPRSDATSGADSEFPRWFDAPTAQDVLEWRDLFLEISRQLTARDARIKSTATDLRALWDALGVPPPTEREDAVGAVARGEGVEASAATVEALEGEFVALARARLASLPAEVRTLWNALGVNDEERVAFVKGECSAARVRKGGGGEGRARVTAAAAGGGGAADAARG